MIERFSITLTPSEAFKIKRGYELEGWSVDMTEMPADLKGHRFKYHYIMTSTATASPLGQPINPTTAMGFTR